VYDPSSVVVTPDQALVERAFDVDTQDALAVLVI
jgi:hypothetical protein